MAGEGHQENDAEQRRLDQARGISPGMRWRIDWGMAAGPESEADKKRGGGSGTGGTGKGGATFSAAPEGILTGGALVLASLATGWVPTTALLVIASAFLAAAIALYAVAASR